MQKLGNATSVSAVLASLAVVLLLAPAANAEEPLGEVGACVESVDYGGGYAAGCTVDEGVDCLWGALGIHAYRTVFEDDEDEC